MHKKTKAMVEGLSVYPLGRAIEVDQGLEAVNGTISDESSLTTAHLHETNEKGWATIWRVVRLKIEEPNQPPRVFPLSVGQYVLGRSVDADIRTPDDKAVSRLHLSLVVHSDMSVEARDLSSANGTYLNGKPVEKGELFEFKKSDILWVGVSVLSLYTRDPTPNSEITG